MLTMQPTDDFPGGRGSTPPPSTEIPSHDQNLLGGTLPILGYGLMCINWVFALLFLGWVAMNQNHDVVKKAQPMFLAFICIGCMVSRGLRVGSGDDERERERKRERTRQRSL